ncbi:VOC family protein [Sphingobium nicotianae]|uniref:VOC family protein n=1 Tax=Sphingobium nicotianae TaxID=2782607 RepID=A0A9X1DDH4_9SPHN|nr:VOC family protein [Sphingobium nicotianae]MBT2188200.1 VOC family protein [Sphingobium nicotianae]
MPVAKLSFFKVIVRDLEKAKRFYERSLSFVQEDFFDTPDFLEAVMRQPGTDFAMMLLAYKDGRDISAAIRHGPTGFFTDDIEAAHTRLVAEGAIAKSGIIVVGAGIRIALLDDPEGHEIELCQMP